VATVPTLISDERAGADLSFPGLRRLKRDTEDSTLPHFKPASETHYERVPLFGYVLVSDKTFPL